MEFLTALFSKLNKNLCRILLLSLMLCSVAQAASLTQLQAALTYSLLNFIRWPDSDFATADAPIVICLLSDDEFQSILELTVKDEKIGARPIRIRALDRISSAPECHLLYVDANNQNTLTATMLEKNYPNAVTVGNGENFAHDIGMIEFKQIDSKLKVLVNMKHLKKSPITISSNLLNIANIVER